MKLKIERDDARTIQQNFFPYLSQLIEVKVKSPQATEIEITTWKIIRSLFKTVSLKFDRKLLTDARKFSINFTEAEGIAFYTMLMKMPIDAGQAYMIFLRDSICRVLHKQISEPA